ncbi:hypothetical protein 2A_00002 [Ralstonia phage Darius]|uniref:DUF2116 family Zn-ribbon domain-containing protein n=2 Tax=Gervaisevirus gervaise TaxID=2846047 RepID=A0A7G5BAG3_9CAUD|nr:DksA-like zinc-finger protein [Ralstonia phage Gervaise]QMV32755.1 hypothetical protein 2A_00002 [Ralstonia phage Darius]QMV33286.1 hypothetical protein 1Ca_00049 [Ralstonia phage Gervaise]
MKHADFLDDAADLTQRETDSLVSSARERAAKPIPTATHCIYCGEETEDGRRFCDKLCLDAFEHEMAARKRNGR